MRIKLRRPEASRTLRELLSSRIPPSSWDWFLRKLRACRPAHFDHAAFCAAFAGAARYLGRAAIAPVHREEKELSGAGVAWPVTTWHQDDLGRAVLLLEAAEVLDTDRASKLVVGCYRAGDVRERASILKALPLLPGADRFVPIALEGARARVPSLLEAIACDNPYPCEYLGDDELEELVLRSLSAGLPRGRIVGLDERPVRVSRPAEPPALGV